MYTLFTNGLILTLAGPSPQALLIKDGKIVGLGALETLRAACGSEKLEERDLEGNTLLPAFIDAHSHILQYSKSLHYADLSKANSFSDVLSLLRAFAKKKAIPEGGWLCGVGYDPDRLLEKRHPLRQVLDALGAYAVLVSAASGHMGCMNSLALERANVTAATPDPAGGSIGREMDGRPNGYLEENAFFSHTGILPSQTQAQRMEALLEAQKTYASYGIVTAQEGLMSREDFDFLHQADKAGKLLMEVVGYASLEQQGCFPREAPNWGLEATGNFRVGGYKLILDGSPQGRTAWLSEPYMPKEGDALGYRGYPAYSDAQVRAFVAFATKEKQQLLIHVNGDAAIDQLLNAYPSPSQTRDVLIHAQTMRADQLPRVKALNLMPSYFVAHVYRYGDLHCQQLGRTRASHISPLKSTVSLGIPFTLHQDTPVMPPNMLHTLYCATCRQTEGGATLGPEERIGLMDALKGVTTNAAYQYHRQEQQGKLLPGMNADLAIVKGNLIQGPLESLKNAQVLECLRSGRSLYQR